MTVRIEIIADDMGQAINQLVTLAVPTVAGLELHQKAAAARAAAQQAQTAAQTAAQAEQPKPASAEEPRAAAHAMITPEPSPVDGEVIPPKRRTRAAPAEKPAPSIELKAEPEAPARAVKPEDVVTLDEVRKALLDAAKTLGNGPIFEILKKFDTQKASDIPEAKRKAVLAAVDEALAAKAAE